MSQKTPPTATRVAVNPPTEVTEFMETGVTEIPAEEVDSDSDPDKDSIRKVMEALADAGPRSMRDVQESPSIPDWVVMPQGFKPPKGVQVVFMKFKTEWTSNPLKGDRQAIAWPITVVEEKNALSRARGDVLRSIDELSKAMVKFIDGKQVDWTGKDRSADIDQWWNEVGPKCRNILHRVYTQTHNLSDDEHADFFENCIAVRTVG